MALLLFGLTETRAQSVLWGADLMYRFDNKEFREVASARSGTEMGVSLIPEMGIKWDSWHSIMIGADLKADIGSTVDRKFAALVLYYKYERDGMTAVLGNFRRSMLTGDYSTAFFDEARYYNHRTMGGALLKFDGGLGHMEIACDWIGMPEGDNRERFMIISSGRMGSDLLHLGYQATLMHYAGSPKVRGVVDNGLTYGFLGTDMRDVLLFDRLALRGGYFFGIQRDRRLMDGFDFPQGWQAELTLERGRFGLYSTYYRGDSLMPYFDEVDAVGNMYGTSLYYGDQFYRVPYGEYGRVELYWKPIVNRFLSLRVSAIQHYDGRKWGWEQAVTLTLNLFKQ